MSSSDSDLALVAYLTVLQEQMAVSMTVLAIFEYVTTLDQEISSIWLRKKSGASLLLLAVRYTMLTTAIMGVLPTGRFNLRECMGYFITNDIVLLFGNVLTAVFSALRVYALCLGNVRVSAVVFLLQLSPVAVNLYNFIESPIGVFPGVGCAEEVNIGPKTGQLLIYVSRIPLTVGDALAVVVTWIKSFRQLRMQRSTGLHLPLSTLMFRDGTVYFLLLLALNVLEMAPITALIGGYIVAGLVGTLPLILVNRFMLNLRQLSEADAQSAAHVRSVSTPMFRVSMDIAGNMGESLEYGWEARNDDELPIEEVLQDIGEPGPSGHHLG